MSEETPHAALWSGWAGSWVDLHPQGAERSFALSTCGTHQAGHVQIDGVSHASVWSGTAGTWQDLSSALPTT